MKATAFILFSLAFIFTLALLYNTKTDKIEDSNLEKFNTLLEDENYMLRFMDSMKSRYPEVVLSSAFEITGHNKGLQSEMMNQMVAMCYSEPAMSEMMMGMAMSMCDIDKEKCAKMSNMMMNHKASMTCMLKMMNEKGIIDRSCMNKAIDEISKADSALENSTHP